VIGGAPDVLAYLGVSLLLAAKRKVESCKSSSQLSQILSKVV
jgi:hypothetical protein